MFHSEKIILIALLTTLSVFLSASASPSAGTITFTPDASSITIPAGSQGTLTVNVDVSNCGASTYYLKIVSAVADGNLPIAWISASPAAAFLACGSPVTTALTISVPQGTPSGAYSGHLMSDARSAHGIAAPGAGFLITVTVPPDCSRVAEFHFTSPDTLYLWPPNHGMESVTIAGTVDIPAGCSLIEAGYSIEDEYGVYTSVGKFSIGSDRSFTFTVPVEAWREGQDKDGRHYTITLFARDEAGIGSSSAISVVVPHDQRK